MTHGNQMLVRVWDPAPDPESDLALARVWDLALAPDSVRVLDPAPDPELDLALARVWDPALGPDSVRVLDPAPDPELDLALGLDSVPVSDLALVPAAVRVVMEVLVADRVGTAGTADMVGRGAETSHHFLDKAG
jgi:hypothetical protein